MVKKISKNILVILTLALLSASLVIGFPNLSYAAPDENGVGPGPVIDDSCGTPTSIIKCDTIVDKDGKTIKNNGIVVLLTMAIKIMTGLVGAIAVVMLIYAGLIYATAADSQEKVKQSKEYITNVVIGLLLYIFLFAILNYLIPGGVF